MTKIKYADFVKNVNKYDSIYKYPSNIVLTITVGKNSMKNLQIELTYEVEDGDD